MHTMSMPVGSSCCWSLNDSRSSLLTRFRRQALPKRLPVDMPSLECDRSLGTTNTVNLAFALRRPLLITCWNWRCVRIRIELDNSKGRCCFSSSIQQFYTFRPVLTSSRAAADVSFQQASVTAVAVSPNAGTISTPVTSAPPAEPKVSAASN